MTSPPSYAPTATSSFAPSQDHLGYHQELLRAALLKLPQHQQTYDALAEVYSIITVLEMVERSFLKDYITDKDKYTSTVLRLINQYLLILRSFGANAVLDELVPQRGADNANFLGADNANFLGAFSARFNLERCQLGIKRLTAGIPATIETLGAQVQSLAAAEPASNKRSVRLVAELTGNFITCMDALKLNYRTREQLHPLLSNLVVSLNDLVMSHGAGDPTSLDFVGKSKLVSWLIRLNGLAAEHELSQAEADAFLEDLDTAYRGFYTSLED